MFLLDPGRKTTVINPLTELRKYYQNYGSWIQGDFYDHGHACLIGAARATRFGTDGINNPMVTLNPQRFNKLYRQELHCLKIAIRQYAPSTPLFGNTIIKFNDSDYTNKEDVYQVIRLAEEIWEEQYA